MRDVLLLNKGEGRFADGSAAFGLAEDRGSIGVAAADFDADRHIDLFLTGVGENRLLRNVDGKRFEDISAVLKPTGVPAVSLMARWLDLDQDGDLDLYVVNYCAAADAEKAFERGRGGTPGWRIRFIATTASTGRCGGRHDPGPRTGGDGVRPRDGEGVVDRTCTVAGGRSAAGRRKSPHRHRRARRRQRSRSRLCADGRQEPAGRAS